ncbi:hypothetical protein M8J71_04095 [Pseudarthrobacter sp. R1]|uniref:hypothetical protein n=1 Tax=Pseudarthrobacter sp. R1 TaxID=2944934 RepID=UPI00210A87E4|nr:hypothetical protein [Pseudarthrobacter sp. R1]MCQ6269669.1 hypothetical protein [Pseudarthrobacter sp. R1]
MTLVLEEAAPCLRVSRAFLNVQASGSQDLRKISPAGPPRAAVAAGAAVAAVVSKETTANPSL